MPVEFGKNRVKSSNLFKRYNLDLSINANKELPNGTLDENGWMKCLEIWLRLVRGVDKGACRVW